MPEYDVLVSYRIVVQAKDEKELDDKINDMADNIPVTDAYRRNSLEMEVLKEN